MQTILSAFNGLGFLVIGLLLGSFANVIIIRMPQGQSIISPRSHCPQCSALIKGFDNIPVISWLLLRGRCRDCLKPISWRYPITELTMGLLFMLTFNCVGWSWTLIEYLVFVFGLVTASFIDLDHMILPDEFTLSGIVLGLIGASINPERSLWDALFGMLMGGGFLYAIAYIYFTLRGEEGMGGGDIKLLGWIGAVLGWKAIPFTIMFSSLTGMLVGLLKARSSPDGLKSSIPFGPFLAMGAIGYFVAGERITEWYLGLFIISPGLN